MFESAEMGHCVDDKTYRKRAPELRADLLDAQYDLIERKQFSVLILINGVEGAGKEETVSLLNEWMDTRHIENWGFGPQSQDSSGGRELPAMTRFWRRLPPKGKIGVFFGTWYTDPIVRRTLRETSNAELQTSLNRIVRLEQMLRSDGVLLLKFWFHLSKRAQRDNLRALERHRETRWRASKVAWENHGMYDRFRAVSERVLRRTSIAAAPWIVVEGQDANFRNLTVATNILQALRNRLDEQNPTEQLLEVSPLPPPIDQRPLLSSLDLSKSLLRRDYERELAVEQGRIFKLVRKRHFTKHALVVVLEGPDAAGKGSTIRRITPALDPRQYRVISVGAPTEDERAMPYLWRFWRHLPERGRVTIFDRSWYGRVLVERVEGYASSFDYQRAYSEINDFEEQLAESGILVVKVWLWLSKDEQLKRFRGREQTRFKRFKITPEDWRNREKWDAYELAAGDMIDRTSTDIATWSLLEANDKLYARVHALRAIRERLEEAL